MQPSKPKKVAVSLFFGLETLGIISLVLLVLAGCGTSAGDAGTTQLPSLVNTNWFASDKGTGFFLEFTSPGQPTDMPHAIAHVKGIICDQSDHTGYDMNYGSATVSDGNLKVVVGAREDLAQKWTFTGPYPLGDTFTSASVQDYSMGSAPPDPAFQMQWSQAALGMFQDYCKALLN